MQWQRMKFYRVYYTVTVAEGYKRQVWHGYAHSEFALYEAFEAYADIYVVETVG
jgi:hypothetical protein